MSETIRVLSSVTASFRLPDGGVFDISPTQRWQLLEAPAGIRTDPIFGWLLRDGSLEVAGLTALTSELENEPDQGVTAEGKKPRRNPAGGSGAKSPESGASRTGKAMGAGASGRGIREDRASGAVNAAASGMNAPEGGTARAGEITGTPEPAAPGIPG